MGCLSVRFAVPEALEIEEKPRDERCAFFFHLGLVSTHRFRAHTHVLDRPVHQLVRQHRCF